MNEQNGQFLFVTICKIWLLANWILPFLLESVCVRPQDGFIRISDRSNNVQRLLIYLYICLGVLWHFPFLHFWSIFLYQAIWGRIQYRNISFMKAIHSNLYVEIAQVGNIFWGNWRSRTFLSTFVCAVPHSKAYMTPQRVTSRVIQSHTQTHTDKNEL